MRGNKAVVAGVRGTGRDGHKQVELYGVMELFCMLSDGHIKYTCATELYLCPKIVIILFF